MSEDFDAEALRPMILKMNGNVARIAKALRADSERLREFIRSTPSLASAMEEVLAIGVDESLSVLFTGLRDDSVANRIASAKVFLRSRSARHRGFTQEPELQIKVGAKGAALALTWLSPEADEVKLIEGSSNAQTEED